jgi:hypothetical protein
MPETEAWIVVVPLLAIAGVLTLYQLYMAYAGRSTRGRHTTTRDIGPGITKR